MTIKEEINQSLIKALKAKETEKVQTLRGLLASLKNAEIEAKGELKDDRVIEVLRKEVKQRKEAAVEYQKGNREDLVKKEKSELDIIEEYLPEEISDQKIETAVKEAIKKTGASSKQDIGKVMGVVMAKLKGQADGARVSQITSKLLS